METEHRNKFGEVWSFGIGPQLASQLYFKTPERLNEFLAQDTNYTLSIINYQLFKFRKFLTCLF